jgi:hypothetical protein
MVDDQAYQRVVVEVRTRLANAGTNLNALLPYMKNEGLSILQAVRAVYEVLGRLDIAKTFTATSTAYRDDLETHEAFRRELVEPLGGTENERRPPEPSMTAERELAELRAALAVTLRLLHRAPGPQGLTLLNVPSDREIIDEAVRLRDLAESSQSRAKGEQSGSEGGGE